MRPARSILPIVCALAATLGSAFGTAQAATRKEGRNAATHSSSAELDSPFAVDSPGSQRINAIEFLPVEAMSAQDRQLADEDAQIIRSKAALAGFDLSQGDWTQRQILCPVFPDHILLLYRRDNGPRDVSQFSAILRRDSQGGVHIVPILRRSYSLFTPAPSNARTIAAFNEIRAQEHLSGKPDWLTTSLCYAALAGTDVALAEQKKGEKATFSFAANPLLVIGENGSAAVQFMDVAQPGEPKSWSLNFDKKGKLLSVRVTSVPGYRVQMLPVTQSESQVH